MTPQQQYENLLKSKRISARTHNFMIHVGFKDKNGVYLIEPRKHEKGADLVQAFTKKTAIKYLKEQGWAEFTPEKKPAAKKASNEKVSGNKQG